MPRKLDRHWRVPGGAGGGKRSVHRRIGTQRASAADFGAAGAFDSWLLLRGRVLAARVPAIAAGIALLAHAPVLALLHSRLRRILRVFGLLAAQQTVDNGQQAAT